MGVFSEMNATSVPSAFQDDTGNPVVFEQPVPAGFQSQISTAPAAAPSSDVVQGASKKQLQQAPVQIKETQESAIVQPVSKAEKEDGEKAREDDKNDKEKRRAHEEAEAKRKAEWEARQAAKKAAEQEQLDRLAVMSDDEAASAAMQRIGADTEKLTRRNMKECISEHIQTMCLEDPDFARKVMHPRKSMIHCIWYINRKAKEFAEQELKDNGMKPENGIYGCDIPDDLCYGWAVEYFNDPNAKEDEEKEEKFTAKPYVGGTAKSKDKPKPKPAAKKAEPKPSAKKETSGQLSLGDLV